MKAVLPSSLLALTLARIALAQATTFDIATFTPPVGWQRSDQNGIVQLQTMRTISRKTTYCQIFLFPSHPGSADAMANFTAEWPRLIAQPYGTTTMPHPETKTSADGWTAVTGSVNVVQRGIPVTAILFTVTGHDRVMSVAIDESGQDYNADIRQFFGSLTFKPPALAQAPAPPPPPAPAAQQSGGSSG